MTDRPAPAGESGMTLIEIMIALVILGVVVVGVLALLATLVRASDLSNRKTEAEAATIAAAEYLKSIDFDYTSPECQDYYRGQLDAYATAHPALGFTPTVAVYRGTDASVASGAEIDTPAAGPCMDGSTPVVRLSVTYAAAAGGVARTQDVVLRCEAAAAKAAGGKCV